MYGGGSRRIEGRGNIQRPGDFEYINTTFLPADKTIQSVRYYARRKEQLRINGEGKDRAGAYGVAPLKQQLEEVIKSRRVADPSHGNHIREVKVQPIIVESSSNGFDPVKYPFSEEERVQVVEQRYFSTQSYYHYIYESELRKEMDRFVHETEAKVMEAFHAGKTDDSNLAKETSQHYLDDKSDRQAKLIESNRKEFDPSSKVGKSKTGNFFIHELAPVHTEYSGRGYQQQQLLFTVNENKRLELSRRA